MITNKDIDKAIKLLEEADVRSNNRMFIAYCNRCDKIHTFDDNTDDRCRESVLKQIK